MKAGRRWKSWFPPHQQSGARRVFIILGSWWLMEPTLTTLQQCIIWVDDSLTEFVFFSSDVFLQPNGCDSSLWDFQDKSASSVTNQQGNFWRRRLSCKKKCRWEIKPRWRANWQTRLPVIHFQCRPTSNLNGSLDVLQVVVTPFISQRK